MLKSLVTAFATLVPLAHAEESAVLRFSDLYRVENKAIRQFVAEEDLEKKPHPGYWIEAKSEMGPKLDEVQAATAGFDLTWERPEGCKLSLIEIAKTPKFPFDAKLIYVRKEPTLNFKAKSSGRWYWRMRCLRENRELTTYNATRWFDVFPIIAPEATFGTKQRVPQNILWLETGLLTFKADQKVYNNYKFTYSDTVAPAFGLRFRTHFSRDFSLEAFTHYRAGELSNEESTVRTASYRMMEFGLSGAYWLAWDKRPADYNYWNWGFLLEARKNEFPFVTIQSNGIPIFSTLGLTEIAPGVAIRWERLRWRAEGSLRNWFTLAADNDGSDFNISGTSFQGRLGASYRLKPRWRLGLQGSLIWQSRKFYYYSSSSRIEGTSSVFGQGLDATAAWQF